MPLDHIDPKCLVLQGGMSTRRVLRVPEAKYAPVFALGALGEPPLLLCPLEITDKSCKRPDIAATIAFLGGSVAREEFRRLQEEIRKNGFVEPLRMR